jgi:creatinine amidohydrolase
LNEYDKFLLWSLTWPEIEENLKTNQIALVGVASTEQHGHHLPLSTDFDICLEICKRSLKKFYDATGQHALLAANITLGIAKHHMSFPGTLALEPETLMNVVKEVCLNFIHHGYKKIIVVQCHGGNKIVLDAALRKVKDATEGKKLFLCKVVPWLMGLEKWKEIRTGPPWASYHGGESETSLMMAMGKNVRIQEIHKKSKGPTYLIPDFTRFEGAKYPGAVSWTWNTPEQTVDGCFGDPTYATAEKGEKALETTSDVFAEFLKQVAELEL